MVLPMSYVGEKVISPSPWFNDSVNLLIYLFQLCVEHVNSTPSYMRYTFLNLNEPKNETRMVLGLLLGECHNHYYCPNIYFLEKL